MFSLLKEAEHCARLAQRARDRLAGRFVFEADLQCYLVVGHLAVIDVAARRDDFEPVEIAQRLAGGGQRAVNGVLDRGGRRADDLGELHQPDGGAGE